MKVSYALIVLTITSIAASVMVYGIRQGGFQQSPGIEVSAIPSR